jgi:acylaminoacyl-peptidase
LFSAAVLRNPVISVGEISSSDIPDWYFSEFGIEYPLSSSSPDIDKVSSSSPDIDKSSALPPPPLVSSKIYTELLSASPISHVDSIKTPVLLLIGSADRRVAPSQGVNFYHALKARYAASESVGVGNRKVEMLIFEGEGHPLDGVEASKVIFEVTKKWLVGTGSKQTT